MLSRGLFRKTDQIHILNLKYAVHLHKNVKLSSLYLLLPCPGSSFYLCQIIWKKTQTCKTCNVTSNMNPSVTQPTILWLKTYHDCKAKYKSDLLISVGKKQVFPCKEKKREILFITQIWGFVEAHQLLAESLLDKMKEGNIIHSPVSQGRNPPAVNSPISPYNSILEANLICWTGMWLEKKAFPQILAFSLYVFSLSLFFSLSYRCLALQIYNYPTVSSKNPDSFKKRKRNACTDLLSLNASG